MDRDRESEPAPGATPTHDTANDDAYDDAPTVTPGAITADAATVAGTSPGASGPPAEPWSGSWSSTPVASVKHYVPDAVIGTGGMGEVVSARDEQIGRAVAIKRLRAANPTPEAAARFLREAQIQGRLEHPAIVPVHEVSRDEAGRPFFVMRQLTGITLADVFASQDPEIRDKFPLARLLRTFAEVCLAIEFAHTRGVVHRDLKPANIMLGDFGEVYVLDWGIARVIGDDDERGSFGDIDTLEDGVLTLAGTVLGTPGYMSAEQIHGAGDLDGRADVYALGCLLFEILAGEPLHPRGHAGLGSALAGIDARPSARCPDREIAPELDAACVAATMLDRGDRFASARELGDAVQRFIDGDRDLAQRRERACAELAVAHAALARGDRDADRRVAIRAAARAVALDPGARAPAELVARLMLEPPAKAPREVEDELEALEREALRSTSGLATRALLAYLAFFPLLYWVGFREPWFLVVGPTLVAGLMAMTWAFAHRPRTWLVPAAIATNIGLIAVFSRVATPFLVAPSLGVVTSMLYAMHPRTIRAWKLWVAMVVAVLGPWLLERVGALSTTTVIADNQFVLQTAAPNQLDPALGFTALTLYVAVMLVTAIGLTRSQALQQRGARRMLQIQAWQLRQLVPRAESVPAGA